MGQATTTATLTERIIKSGKKQKGGGSGKHKRNAAKCKLYREVRSKRNKLRKIERHLKRYDEGGRDQCARTALNRARQM